MLRRYTNDGNAWFVNGYLHYDTKVINKFSELFGMTDSEANQKDWPSPSYGKVEI